MEDPTLPDDFREVLKLLNDNKEQYPLIGGYAVGYHGYPRATADLNVWIAIEQTNATAMVRMSRSMESKYE